MVSVQATICERFESYGFMRKQLFVDCFPTEIEVAAPVSVNEVERHENEKMEARQGLRTSDDNFASHFLTFPQSCLNFRESQFRSNDVNKRVIKIVFAEQQ